MSDIADKNMETLLNFVKKEICPRFNYIPLLYENTYILGNLYEQVGKKCNDANNQQ